MVASFDDGLKEFDLPAAPGEEVRTLSHKKTIEKVWELFRSDKEIFPIESFPDKIEKYRLIKTKVGTINFEKLITLPIDIDKDQDLQCIKTFPNNINGRIVDCIVYLKPIGFFTQNTTLANGLELTILKEYENELGWLLKHNAFPSSIKVNLLTFEENAVLAAFSMEALMNAQKYKDISFYANGLYCDIVLTHEGFPQIFLDYRYRIDGAIAAYLIKEENAINPITQYKHIFDKLDSMDLMTCNKNSYKYL